MSRLKELVFITVRFVIVVGRISVYELGIHRFEIVRPIHPSHEIYKSGR